MCLCTVLLYLVHMSTYMPNLPLAIISFKLHEGSGGGLGGQERNFSRSGMSTPLFHTGFLVCVGRREDNMCFFSHQSFLF